MITIRDNTPAQSIIAVLTMAEFLALDHVELAQLKAAGVTGSRS
jgi:hypothetical protein